MWPPEAFTSSAERARRLLAEAQRVLDSGQGNTAYAMQLGFEQQLKLAEIALHANAPNADVRKASDDATNWGLRWALNDLPSAPLPVTRIDVSVSSDGELNQVSRQQSSTAAG